MAYGNSIKSGSKSDAEGSSSSDKRVKIMRTEAEGNNEDEATSTKFPIEKALQNTLVLQNIFKFLTYNDLVSCQSVDLPLWSSEAKYSISVRPILTISLNTLLNRGKCSVEMVKTFQDNKIKYEFKSIAELSSKLETCEKGHEIRLTINQVGSSEDLKAFLTKFAVLISKLSLWAFYWANVLTPSDLQGLLGQLKNLNHLYLATLPIWWLSKKEVFSNQESSSSDSDNSSFLLPQVKTIAFGTGDNFYPELLTSLFEMTPNLDKIFNFPLDSISNSAADDKLKLDKIKSVDVSKLSTSGEKLQQKLNIIKDSLEYLKIAPVDRPLDFPEMKTVKKLCLAGLASQSNLGIGAKFFGENFDAGKTFPILVEATLEFMVADFGRFFPDNAKTTSCFQSVTTLSLAWLFGGSDELEALEKVVRVFPNVTSFASKGYVRGLERQLPHVFRLWPKLTSLKMKVSLSNIVTHQFPLDSVFTGISPEKCNALRESKEKTDIDLQSYRQNFAISNMTDLKELTLIFIGWYSARPEVIPHLSHVAASYGFQCVPDLKVTCAIPWDNKDKEKIEEMLQPILEYVKFQPNYVEPLDLAEALFF